jgi:hypothetical protein
MSVISDLRKQISSLNEQILDIQNECSHPISCLKFKYEADTGNWCSADDSYWTVYTCSLCEKRWSEDGSNNLPVSKR